ncbi:MAG: alkaline phosphatase family protein [Dehalococcoidales bacterium]|nr:alkaline phosphatase family protein [Dehalococcoidales bacterium]
MADTAAKKAMVLGIDSPIPPRVYRWAAEGKLPNLKKLIDNGVYAPNCLVPLPTITPPNWTTIATGAWAGTHGITDYQAHTPGQPLYELHNAYAIDESQAEPLWEAVGRAGKSAVVVNWPTTWPPRLKNGCQIGGSGLAPTDWQFEMPAPFIYRAVLAVDALITTDIYPYASQVEFAKASGWSGVEHSDKALDASVVMEWRRPRYEMEPVIWHVLVDASEGTGYDTVVVAKAKTKDGVYTRLKVGEWTGNLFETFATEVGPQDAVMRMKLVELSPDAQSFRLYVVGPYARHGWGYPSEIEDEIKSEDGLPMAKAAWEGLSLEWIDADTVVEAYHLQNTWLADAVTYLLKNKPWSVFFTHLHSTDWLYHYLTLKLDPLTAENPAEVDYWQGVELRLYQDVDATIGKMLEAADEDTVVVVISDHGAKTQTRHFDANDVLEQAGLLHYLPADQVPEQVEASKGLTGGMAKALKAYLGLRRVDWGKTKAVAQRSVHVYVNLKGRDPDGIVEPGEEYQQICRQVVEALYGYVDPESGRRPIALALGPEDRRLLGHYSNRSGDVIYAVQPDFGREHGQQLTTASYGIGDLHGLFIMAGPGVKKGEILERSVWLTDIVPTVCHLAKLPIPKQCEGAVLYQALVDPDAHL